MALLGPLQRMLRVARQGACDGRKPVTVGNTADHSTYTVVTVVMTGVLEPGAYNGLLMIATRTRTA
jgi:hypothetical protein